MLVVIFTELLLFVLGTGYIVADGRGTHNVTFSLYTNENPTIGYILKTSRNRNFSHFDSLYETIFLIHGWSETGNSDWVQKAVRTYLDVYECNVIVVDWSSAQEFYHEAVASTNETGKNITKLIRFLEKSGNLSLNDVHIVGHSLGAHVSSVVGHKLKGKIGRITGLDPAGPLYIGPFQPSEEYMLDPSDAQFVDIIHTNGWIAGTPYNVGHADFFPNGGFTQYGCNLNPICNHQRSIDYMIESIKDPEAFPALHCNTYVGFRLNICAFSDVAYMGEGVSVKARGKFYLDTFENPPYGKRNLRRNSIFD